MNILALDLSSTATGICTPDGVTSTCAPKGDLHQRCRLMTRHIKDNHLAWLRDGATGIDLIAVEGIATRHVQTAIAIASIHTRIIDLAFDAGVPIVTYAPTQIKRWATGKGAADKTRMVLAAEANGWKPEIATATDDQADAWWIWTLATAHHTGTWIVPETAYRTELLEGIKP